MKSFPFKKLGMFFTSKVTILYGAIILAFIFGLLTFRLGSLTGGLSAGEFALWQQVNTDSITPYNLLADAVFLPHKLGLFVLQQLPFHGAGSIRAISVIFGLFAIAAFYKLLRRWYTVRVAAISTVLFIGSGWFLHTARLAAPDILYVNSIVLLALWAWLRDGKQPRIALPLLALGAVLAFYVPGSLFVLLPALIWQRKYLVKAFQRVPNTQAIATVFGCLLLLVPFIFTLVRPSTGTTMDQLRTFAGLPVDIPSITQYGSNILSILKEIFIRGDGNALLTIGNLPLLDVFTTVMFITGLIVFATNFKLDRSKFVFFVLVLGLLLSALGGPITIAVLLPFIYLVAAEGIRHLLQEWLNVFPRNPVARGIGVGIIMLSVAVAVTYHARSYFIAWPHTNDTQNTFDQRL